VFVIVSRQVLIDSQFSSVTCAPIYTAYDGLSTQVAVGVEVGLKHASSIHCDELISIPKSSLTDFVGRLGPAKVWELDRALSIALGLE
jgi:mRNA interferase MazF